jgi:hypothetical protein
MVKVKEELARYLAKLGAKGGKAAAAKLTPDERRERARNAVQARERKRKLARKGEKSA